MLAPSDSFSLASLKAKLLACEDQVRALTIDLLRVQREMQVLTAQIDTLRQLQVLQSTNSQSTLQEERTRLEHIMKQQFAHEKEQRRRFQQEIEELRTQKLDLQESVLALSQRMQLLAGEIGL